jgi:GTPase SAR1 family protein
LDDLSHYKNSAGALIVFDTTNQNSFNDVIRWIGDVKDRCNENVVIGIIGNKVDMENRRVVNRRDAEKLA